MRLDCENPAESHVSDRKCIFSACVDLVYMYYANTNAWISQFNIDSFLRLFEADVSQSNEMTSNV